jgi:hypothetical protein
MSDFIVRTLQPPLARTLALIEHRNKPNEPALDIVRGALLSLRAAETIEPVTDEPRPKKPGQRRARGGRANPKPARGASTRQ